MSNLGIRSEIRRLSSIPDYQEGISTKLSPAKPGIDPQGGESTQSAFGRGPLVLTCICLFPILQPCNGSPHNLFQT